MLIPKTRDIFMKLHCYNNVIMMVVGTLGLFLRHLLCKAHTLKKIKNYLSF